MIIRNNKDNILFEPGYAFINDKLVRSHVFINDVSKSRQEIDIEDLEKIQSFNISERAIFDAIEKTAPTKQNKEKLKLLLSIFVAATSAGILFLNVGNIKILSSVAALSTLSFSALSVYQYDKLSKIKRTSRMVIASIEAKRLLDEKIKLDSIAPTEVEKNLVELNIVAKKLSNVPYNNIYNKLGITLREKIEDCKKQENVIVKKL